MKKKYKFHSPIHEIHRFFAVSLLMSLTNDISFKQAFGLSMAARRLPVY